MFFLVSQETPEEPVLSPVSGHVYERRVIVKHIEANGTDPANSLPLTIDQLITIEASPIIRPRQQSATSIPSMLKLMQDEWDSIMLHSFSLRMQLQKARQELSHSLYQHDAACRVIARLNKEVAAAREALATLKPQAKANGQVAMDVETAVPTPVRLPEEVCEKLQAKAAVLTEERRSRGRTVPKELTPADQIRDFRLLQSHNVSASFR